MRANNLLYASFFRVVMGIILMIDVLTGIFFANDIYIIENYIHTGIGEVYWVEALRGHIYSFLSAYALILLLWILGIGKNFTTLLVFLFFCLDFILMSPAVFWGDSVLRTTLLFFIFVDSFHFYSIRKSRIPPTLIHRLAIWSILLHVCYLYGVNAFHKLQNVEWLSGYALAYFFEYSKTSDVLNIGKLMTYNVNFIRLSSWSIIIFQLTFPIFIWFKRLKWWWILFGIITHVIMAFVLQVYKFELIIFLHYGFFISDKEWKRIFRKLKYVI